MPLVDKLRKFAFIDAARGIAILMVVLVHATNRRPGLSFATQWIGSYGNMGVQLFFVASAYTLCLSHMQRRDEPHALRAYFIRRYFRIAPLYYLAMVLYFAMNTLRADSDPGARPDYGALSVLSNIFFLHGVAPQVTTSLVPGGWSIGTEMLFYVLFPVLFVLALRLESWRPRASLVMLPVLFAIDCLVQPLFWAPSQPRVISNDEMYGHIVNQLPVFLLGIYAYFQDARPPRADRPADGRPVAAFAAFVAVTVASLLLGRVVAPFTFAVVPIVSGVSFLFLLEALKQIRDPGNLLCRIGRVSFSMYIFHFPVIHAVTDVATRVGRGGANPELLLLGTYVASVGVTFAVALASEKWIERPGIALGKRLIERLARGDAPRASTADASS